MGGHQGNYCKVCCRAAALQQKEPAPAEHGWTSRQPLQSVLQSCCLTTEGTSSSQTWVDITVTTAKCVANIVQLLGAHVLIRSRNTLVLAQIYGTGKVQGLN